MRMTPGWTIVLLGAGLLAGCKWLSQPLPKCSDDSTLDLVRKILAEHALGTSALPPVEQLRKRLIFRYPHATKLEENIRKYSCEADLVIVSNAETHEVRLEYESQIDDAGDHLVQVGGISLLDASSIRAVLSSVPAPTGVTQPPVDAPLEPADTDNEAEAAKEVTTPEQLEVDRIARAAVLDGSAPSGDHPRFRDYLVQDVYAGAAAPLDMSSETAKTFRTRLRDALSEGDIAAAGEYVVAGWGCGGGCFYNTFVNKRTGLVIEQGIGGEEGQRIIGMDARSRLVIAEGPELDDDYNEIGYFAYFYELTDDRLTLIGKTPIPRALDE